MMVVLGAVVVMSSYVDVVGIGEGKSGVRVRCEQSLRRW